MNNDLISRSELIKAFNEAQVEFDEYYKGLGKAKVITDNAPTVEAVTVEHHNRIKGILQNEIDSLVKIYDSERPQGEFTRKELESWLYRIASNNLDNELGRSCEEIIGRLDGFERFVSDMRKGGAE